MPESQQGPCHRSRRPGPREDAALLKALRDGTAQQSHSQLDAMLNDLLLLFDDLKLLWVILNGCLGP